MKGLQEETDSGNIYLVVKHGAICQESKTEVVGFQPVEVKNPRTGETITKYIKRYKTVEGMICKVEWYDTEEKYENRFIGWKIHIDAAGVPAVLDLPFDSRASNRFMKVAENLDFSQPVEFRAWHDQKTDSTAFYIGQNGQSVPQLYTQEHPGECPPPVQNPVTKKWNFDKQKEFLHARMIDSVIPAVEEQGNEMPRLEMARAAAASSSESHAPESDLSDDDIPF
jgi:hypothetical protein